MDACTCCAARVPRVQVSLLDALKNTMVLREASSAVPAVPESVRWGVLVLQRQFCVLSALHLKFEREFGAVFSQTASGGTGEGSYGVLMAFAWTVFAIVKNTYLREAATTGQLLVLYQLLVCCVHYTACHAPTQLLAPALREAAEAAAGPPPLAAVCQAMGVQLDETEVGVLSPVLPSPAHVCGNVVGGT